METQKENLILGLKGLKENEIWLTFDNSNDEISFRCPGSFLRDTLTVSLDTHPAQALHRKLLLSVRPKCHPLLLDHNLNSRENILFNAYQTFLLAAHKFHTYIKELPKGGSLRGFFTFCVDNKPILIF